MKKELIILADHLDKKGLQKEADYLDLLVKRAEVTDTNPADTLTSSLELASAMLTDALQNQVWLEQSENVKEAYSIVNSAQDVIEDVIRSVLKIKESFIIIKLEEFIVDIIVSTG